MSSAVARYDAGTERATKRTVSILAVLVPPWILAVLTLIAGLVTHGFWAGSPWAAAAIAVVTMMLAGLVTMVSRAPNTLGKAHAAVTPLLMGGWITTATITGVISNWHLVHPTVDMWLIGAPAMAISWNIRIHVRHGGGHGSSSLWDELTEKASISGVKVKPTQVTENRFKGKLQLPAGELTVDQVQKATDNLASGLRVPPRGVRIAPDPDNASQATITIVRKDLLRVAHDFQIVIPDGPPTQSVVEPFYGGLYEDGEEVNVRFYVPGYGFVHLLIQGMTGAGKTAWMLGLLAQGFLRSDLITIGIDVKKAPQSFKDIHHGLDMIIDTEAKAKRLFKVMKKEAIPARTRSLARLGLDKWEAGCGLPAIWLCFEEAGGVVEDDPAFVSLMETMRSLGIFCTTSMQRASYGRLDTDARANFGGGVCFGVDDEQDARFVLSDHLVDAGADPSVWRTSRPGCAYFDDPATDDIDRKVTPLRGPRIDTNKPVFQALLSACASYHAEHGPALDPDFAEALGEIWSKRTNPLADLFGTPSEQTTAAVRQALTPPPAAATADNGFRFTHDKEEDDAVPQDNYEDEDEVEVTEEDMGIDSFDEADTDPGYQPGPDDDMPELNPEGTGFRFGAEQGQVDTDEARRVLSERIERLRANGRTTMKIDDLRDLFDVPPRLRSRSWFYLQLKTWAEEGLIERVDAGEWDITAYDPEPADRLAVAV